jgi:hypothetical protein
MAELCVLYPKLVLKQGGERDEKEKRDWSRFSGSSSAVRSTYINSFIPRQRFDIVGR